VLLATMDTPTFAPKRGDTVTSILPAPCPVKRCADREHSCCQVGLAGLPAVGARHFLLGLGLTGYLYPSTNLA